MELIAKLAAAAVLGCGAALLMKKNAGAMALPLSAAVCAFALYLTAGMLKPVMSLLEETKALSGLSGVYFLPVVKCVAIGILAKGAADLCRDGGQGAMAGAVELGGTAAALYVSLPLLRTLLELLEKLL